jgi:hypothetical protein
MSHNYLEQIVSEWYEYQGYFVRRNVLVGKRAKGGYECELDVVAFHPAMRRLVHIEPSSDADSWETREKRYTRKFEAGRKYIPDLFKGVILPNQKIEQIAVLVFGSKTNHETLAGGRLMLAEELLAEILAGLKDSSIYSSAVSEQYPILRTLQFVCQYRNAVARVLTAGRQK